MNSEAQRLEKGFNDANSQVEVFKAKDWEVSCFHRLFLNLPYYQSILQINHSLFFDDRVLSTQIP